MWTVCCKYKHIKPLSLINHIFGSSYVFFSLHEKDKYVYKMSTFSVSQLMLMIPLNKSHFAFVDAETSHWQQLLQAFLSPGSNFHT